MRFERKNDHYLDTKTGLQWSLENFGPMTWDEALWWETANDNEWQLPTVKELLALVNHELANPATELPGMKPSHYWSSDTHASSTDHAWLVHFHSGYDNWSHLDHSYYVRAVRGGNNVLR